MMPHATTERRFRRNGPTAGQRVAAWRTASRDEYGSALIAISWYRSPAHNQALIAADEAASGNLTHQVASASQHVEGYAIDLRPVQGDAGQLYRVLMDAYTAGRLPALGGIGLYPKSNWCHVDCFKAPDGHLRRWLGV